MPWGLSFIALTQCSLASLGPSSPALGRKGQATLALHGGLFEQSCLASYVYTPRWLVGLCSVFQTRRYLEVGARDFVPQLLGAFVVAPT